MVSFYRFKVFIVLLLLIHTASAQQNSINYKLLNAKVFEYEKAEWDITFSAAYNNPYDQQEITLDMFLTSPSGKPIVLPCYFEKGDVNISHWKARFAPQETGVYSYYFNLKSKSGNFQGQKSRFLAVSSKSKGFLHKNNLWTFKFDNGEVFRALGENVAWESRSFENPKWTYDYLLPTLSKNGANFFRTWMCYWNLPLEWKKVSSTNRYTSTNEYFNRGAMKRMDELVHLTDSLGLYFMLTLDWHGHLIENGGWKDSPYNAINGGPCKAPVDFFIMTAARQKYKNKLRYIIARWGYSTNIAALEFFNEVDNAAFNGADSILIPHQYITQWHDDMSRYLKDIDPYKHMVTTSVSHRDIAGMNSLAYIDFNQKHIYKHTEKIKDIYPDYILNYNKPYVIGEFGLRWEDDEPKYAKEADADYRHGLWYGLFSSTPILPMSWWWELFDNEKMTPYFRNIRAVSDRMLQAGRDKFEQFELPVAPLYTQAVKCGNRRFVYLQNNTNDLQSLMISLPYADLAKTSLEIFIPLDQNFNTIEGFKSYKMQHGRISVKIDPGQSMILNYPASHNN